MVSSKSILTSSFRRMPESSLGLIELNANLDAGPRRHDKTISFYTL